MGTVRCMVGITFKGIVRITVRVTVWGMVRITIKVTFKEGTCPGHHRQSEDSTTRGAQPIPRLSSSSLLAPRDGATTRQSPFDPGIQRRSPSLVASRSRDGSTTRRRRSNPGNHRQSGEGRLDDSNRGS